MVVFNPAPIIASMAFRRRQQEESRLKREEERKEQERKERKFPFKNKVLKGDQIEIYPYYAVKMVEQYKIEPNGQINCLEKVYKTKEIVKCYKLKEGNNFKIIQENY